jgi:solute carrier family 25 citrate transporter 1
MYVNISVLLYKCLFLCFHFPGFGGLYKGVTATILKQGSNQAIRFFVMETCKDLYRGGDPKKPIPTLVTGVFGAFAGACSVFGNTPIDVVKTRMQV